MINRVALEEKYGIKYLARLACLIEGVNLACDKAEMLGQNIDLNSEWNKPIAFVKYIDEREKDLTHSIQAYCLVHKIKPGLDLVEEEIVNEVYP